MTEHLLKYDSPIYNLQVFLRTISQKYPLIPNVLPDGYYGDATIKAVIAFQNMQGLSPTGVTDNATWNEIVRLYEAIEWENTSRKLDFFPEEDLFLENDSYAPTITIIQTMLNSLSERFSNLESVEINGINDEATQTAIIKLQSISGLNADGTVTKPFVNVLTALYEAYVSKDRVKNSLNITNP